jgi:hypothetical protein
MGRQGNLEILLPYVDRALQIDAIDHYYMIDMTRCDGDHQYIHNKQQELDTKYPGRVHLVNHKTRKKQLKNGTWKDTLGFWEPFYRFCETFNDDDIVIKCDDDTMFFDIETIAAACELRWKNKHPFLMHANTINNGMCAYHQANKGIWKDKLSKQYPTSGLTGPLFSHPELACDHHEMFADDMSKSYDNIKKYQLDENIYFTARVSINFIFMLGKDRKMYCDINAQDEYVTSSKIGQRANRPNMIIGDFVAAHHTYGVQEPVMENRGTIEMYKKLATICADKDIYINKPINASFNNCGVMKHADKYLMKYWANKNSYTIKNTETDKYISLSHTKTERVKFLEDKTKVGTGVYWDKSELSAEETGTLFTLDLTKPGLAQIQECTEIIKSEIPGTQDRFITFPVKLWFQKNYTKQKIKFIKQDSGNYLITPEKSKNHSLVVDSRNKTLYFFDTTKTCEWQLQPYGKHSNDVVLGQIIKDTPSDIENDATRAWVPDRPELPRSNNFREFYWMVTNYIWEYVPVNTGFYIKLIADDLPDLYLSITGRSKIKVNSNPHVWCTDGKKIKSQRTGKYIAYKDGEFILSLDGIDISHQIK